MIAFANEATVVVEDCKLEKEVESDGILIGDRGADGWGYVICWLASSLLLLLAFGREEAGGRTC